MKVMILAAGKGTRMQPLTDQIPKPLLKVNGASLMHHHLISLAAHGFKEVVVNVSHLAHLIQEEIGSGEKFGVNVRYSLEPEPLETGGGIYQALHLLGDKPFLVINGDIWTDYPWQKLPTELGDNLVHLVLVDNPAHHQNGDYHLQNNRIIAKENERLTYSGIGVISPKIFTQPQEKKFRLTEPLLKAIEQKMVTGEHYCGHWVDVGTPDRFTKLASQFNDKLIRD